MEDDLTFLQIIDGLSATIATTTADGRVEFANSRFLDYLAMPLEELKSWDTSGAVHRDDLPLVIAGWRQSLERGEPYLGRRAHADRATATERSGGRREECGDIHRVGKIGLSLCDQMRKVRYFHAEQAGTELLN